MVVPYPAFHLFIALVTVPVQDNGSISKRPMLRSGGSRWKIAALSVLTLGSITGLAAAIERYFTTHIARKGSEQRLVFKLDAPYGSVDLQAGTNQSDVATIESLDEDANAHNCQWSYGMRPDYVGLLRIGVGTDEGMLGQPPIAMWYAKSGFSTVSAPVFESDQGSPIHPSSFSFSLPPLAPPPLVHPRFTVISTDGGTYVKPESSASTRIHLSRDIPMDFTADLGFGESSIDLTGLALTSAAIETGASRAVIYCNQPNTQSMRSCSLRAGIGQCTFVGLSNLNSDRFNFHGAVGSYHLAFDGRLTHNMDAVVELGLGVCSVTIPATAARVQVFSDDGLLSSFSFAGLAQRRGGYYTSPGFDRSNSPILTLHVSSGAGKISVIYH